MRIESCLCIRLTTVSNFIVSRTFHSCFAQRLENLPGRPRSFADLIARPNFLIIRPLSGLLDG